MCLSVSYYVHVCTDTSTSKYCYIIRHICIITDLNFDFRKSGGGMFSMFKNLVGSKTLTAEDLQPALEKMRDHLIGK